VHIADVVDLYLLALEKAPAATFAFVESGEAAFLDMAQAIADALELGDPVSMTPEAAVALWGRPRALYSLASNSRVRSLRTRAWGWAPRHPSVRQWITDHFSSDGTA
jgi:nucleoside-diphosphate-sugar epimerase